MTPIERSRESVRRWDETRRTVPRPDISVPTSPPTPIQQFKVQTINDDYLDCKTWDGTTLGSTTIKVAKPMVLRKASYWPNGSSSYGSWGTGAQTRTDTSVTPNETQAVVVPYVTSGAGQIIKAFQPTGGTGLTVSSVPVIWEDCNNDARAWCKT